MKRPAEELRPDAPAEDEAPAVWSEPARSLLRLLDGPDDEHAGRLIPFRGPEDRKR